MAAFFMLATYSGLKAYLTNIPHADQNQIHFFLLISIVIILKVKYAFYSISIKNRPSL
jgi:hypothetical protein